MVRTKFILHSRNHFGLDRLYIHLIVNFAIELKIFSTVIVRSYENRISKTASFFTGIAIIRIGVITFCSN